MRGLKINYMKRGHSTDRHTSQLYESISPKGRCFEEKKIRRRGKNCPKSYFLSFAN